MTDENEPTIHAWRLRARSHEHKRCWLLWTRGAKLARYAPTVSLKEATTRFCESRELARADHKLVRYEGASHASEIAMHLTELQHGAIRAE
jgi:hypothetical protein